MIDPNALRDDALIDASTQEAAAALDADELVAPIVESGKCRVAGPYGTQHTGIDRVEGFVDATDHTYVPTALNG